MDVIKRWTPLSLLLAMEGVVESQTELLHEAWELAGRPPLVLRRYCEPREGGEVAWGIHANESMELARRCIDVGIPKNKLILKPFNEPNMPRWAQWEGFGDQPADIARYNEALLLFMYVVRRDLPGVRIGGPHLTVGNRDVRFPNDPPGVYYYHGKDGRFESSPCLEALSALDVHFVHTYGMAPGQYADRAHGLRFLEYEKYLKGKDFYVVEGAYGINSGQAPDQNTVRGQETVAYLKLLGERYPQVKGVALWIGGDPGAGWFAFCHSNGSNPESHRPVVYAVEAASKADAGDSGGVYPQPEPDAGTEKETNMDTKPTEPYKLMTAFARHGIPDVVDLRNEIESFSNMPELEKLWRPFSMLRLVVVHHSGSELAAQTPVSIARYHVSKGGATIPYHFCIDFEGRLFFTARLCWRLPHSGKDSTNAEGIGVCVLGNCEKQQPTDSQLDTLRRLIWRVLPEFVGGDWGQYRGLYVIPHGRLVKTLCPGANLLDALIYRGQWPMSFDTGSAPLRTTQDAFFRVEQAGERVDGERGRGEAEG
jgi:hypothetical protein